MSFLDDYRAALEPAIGAEAAEKAVTILERDWQGLRPYVGKRRPAPDARLTPKQISIKYGVARSTAHSWAMKWRK